jgi:hypothetical protein
VEINQVFPTFEDSVALCMYRYHHPSVLLLGDGARKEAAGVEQYVLVRGD